MSYFIATWNRQLNAVARKRAELAIAAIDAECVLVCHNEPGNDIRMWIERPNDGTNDYVYQQENNRRCREAVNIELASEN